MATVTDETVAGLPPPVARSLRRSGVVGREIPGAVLLRQSGELLLRDRWLPFTADEEYRLDPPGFVWRGDVRLAGVPIAHAEDSLNVGRGRMRVRLLGLIPVVDEAGLEIDQGSLLRWLNETIWFPHVWATDVISWTPLDERSARGSVSVGDLTVEAEFRFDDEGRVVDFRADRYRSADSGFVLTPWRTPITAHARFDGIEVPASGNAVWEFDDGDLEYIRLRVTDVAYDPRVEAPSGRPSRDDPTTVRATMRAIVYGRYGSPETLGLAEVHRPTVGDGEVLVRVEAAGVNTADVDYLRGRPYVARLGTGWPRPRNRVLGLDVAGRVEAIGNGVTQFRPGDEVFGDLTEFGFGAFAEYVCAPAAAFAPKPAGLTFEEAAVVPQSAVMALQGLGGTERIRPGDEVLINGAGGGVGQFAVQIANSLGAEVTGVDGATKLDLVRAVGADHVIDYTQENYAKRGARYDRILDVAATRSVFESRRALKPGGSYVAIPGSVGGLLQTFILGPLISVAGSRSLGMLKWKPLEADAVAAITRLIEAGEVRPVIDRSYRLEEIGEALRYQEEGPSRGKVVIVV